MSQFKSIDELENYLFYTLPSFSRDAYAAYKPGLDRMHQLLHLLGNPEKKFNSIHVAGTNGKGSVTNILADSLVRNGQKTGKYTSPHLVDYRERIQVEGRWIDEQYLLDFVNAHFGDIQEIKPSFFELTVAIAFNYFADKKVDVAVVEVGMGGELDSTNVLDPLVSIITNIGLDHQYALGENLPEIAEAKAGIIKKNKPVVIGETQSETTEIFTNTAHLQQAEIYWADQNYRLTDQQYKEGAQELRYEHEAENICIVTDMLAAYQSKNIGTCLMATEILEHHYSGLQSSMIHALKDFQERNVFQGRWQVLDESPRTILEVAHNKEGVQEVLRSLKQEEYKELYIIMGLSSDKDFEQMLYILPMDAKFIFTAANSKRAQDPEILKKEANKQAKEAVVISDSSAALRYAKEQAKADDLILILGSLYLAGEVLSQYPSASSTG